MPARVSMLPSQRQHKQMLGSSIDKRLIISYSETVPETCTLHIQKPLSNPKELLFVPCTFSTVTRTTGHFKPSPITAFIFLNEFFLSFAHIESTFFLERHIHKDILLKGLEKTFWFSQHTNMSLIKANHRSSLFLCQSITEEGKWNLCESRPLGRLMGNITESGPLRGSRGS